MPKGKRDKMYVRVKDGAGNEFLCPLDALKDPKKATGEELENCVDDATVGRSAGDIEIIDEYSFSNGSFLFRRIQ
jgi:hypothetical protein